jgi:hypothetical protein
MATIPEPRVPLDWAEATGRCLIHPGLIIITGTVNCINAWPSISVLTKSEFGPRPR